ncbi:hypothetical protein RHSP_26257 [Rhizobium freirei PRF 81]|uniref:Uncharacterized protein n=1 Tax=Rhizobium freirei PRF 81 TaxID=363754 RepID=N6V8H7_9HYPH|nr:hypothetical protein RHSP_26257 [Rhizobium freirei PRF 81]
MGCRRKEGRNPGSDQLGEGNGRVGHAAGEAPFVVVPGQDAHEVAFHDLGLVAREDRRVAVMVEVAGNQRLVGVAEDALQLAVRCSLDGFVDFADRRCLLGHELEIDNRDVRGGNADRRAVELALQVRQNETNGLSGARRGRDHGQGCGAGAVQVLVHGVERRLVAGVGVDGRHEAVVDANGVVENLHDRHQAVRGAGSVGDDHVLAGELVVVDAENDGQVGAVGRSRNDDALSTGRQVGGGLVAGREDARAFHGDVDAEFLVRQRCRILDRRDLDRLAAANDDRVAFDLHFRRELAVNGIVTQQVSVGLDRAEVVDGNDFDVGAAGFDDCAQYVTADAAKAVDGYFYSH